MLNFAWKRFYIVEEGIIFSNLIYYSQIFIVFAVVVAAKLNLNLT